jgi:hypothetical protein
MSKQYMVVNDDQILVDMNLIFSAIREAKGDWQQVEADLKSMLSGVQSMIETAEQG